MRILLGTFDIAGWLQQLKTGFEEFDHEVTIAVSEKPEHFVYNYDYVLGEFWAKNRFKKELSRYQIVSRLIRKIKNYSADLHYRRFIFKLIDQHDLIIKLWHPFLNDNREDEYIRKKNKKFIRLFVGSDARYFNAFAQEYAIHHWEFPADFTTPQIELKLSPVRNAERYADLIYSVPDQAGLQLRPYYHLQVPIDLRGISFLNNKRHIPKVIHAPSIPFKKGTDIIENTLKQLKSEGVEFQFISVRNMQNREILSLLSDADILVDEIVGHGPGALSFEAMASGCAVATRYLEDSPKCFRPPVWSINADNIYEKLKELLTNFELQQRLIVEGREYVLANNTALKVAGNILKDLESNRAGDYMPTFLRDNYTPKNGEEVLEINHWTSFVKKCDWYKKYIQPGERAGLKF